MAKNIKDILMGFTNFPAAIEAKLPAGAPKISTMLVDATGKIPAVPDFPVEIPDLPAPPELPAIPTPPGAPELRRFVTGVPAVGPPAAPPARAVAVSPMREKIPLVFE